MPASLYIQEKNEPHYIIGLIVIVCKTLHFVLNDIIGIFLGGGMVMWTTNHYSDFCPCNLLYNYCLNTYNITNIFRISMYVD